MQRQSDGVIQKERERESESIKRKTSRKNPIYMKYFFECFSLNSQYNIMHINALTKHTFQVLIATNDEAFLHRLVALEHAGLSGDMFVRIAVYPMHIAYGLKVMFMRQHKIHSIFSRRMCVNTLGISRVITFFAGTA